MKQLLCPLVCGVGLALILLSLVPAHAGDWPEDCGKNKSHHFFYGGRGLYDKILYVNQTIQPRSWLRKLSFDIEIPPKGYTGQRGTITYIEVLDQYHNGDGGCAYLKSGGPGHSNVVLHIKSQRNEGVNFIINVYGQ